jgi:pyridoxal phosphate enzyme (YggS family)
VAQLIQRLRVDDVRANLNRVRATVAAAAERAGRDPDGVEMLAATKYVPSDEMPKLAEAGITLVGENRARELQDKVAAHGDLFTWDFIGQLQSRRVRSIVPHVRLIHSLASESARSELARCADRARPGLQVLVEVNVAREPGKAGVAPEEIEAYVARCPFPVVGLMTMPPLTHEPEASRRWFAELRQLGVAHGLEHLSMGTTQDYAVAVEEGATILRLGSCLYA